MNDRFVRQADLIPRELLAREQVTVIGVGAIGRQAALQLASIGVRRLRLVDFDHVDETNVTTQGYRLAEVGMPKVEATRRAVLEIDPIIEVTTIEDRFRLKYTAGGVVFCCVDSIDARSSIWRLINRQAQFYCDGRMLGEVIRVLTVAGGLGRSHYPATLFPASEAQRGTCTSRSTIYAAAIAAGLMSHQLSRWLRGQPVTPDLCLNLLADELSVPRRGS